MKVKISIFYKVIDIYEIFSFDNIDLFLDECLPVLQIHEFRSSEDYHFHSKKQMELVSVMCPKISKVKQ